ncbi:NAD-dependent epimerase/dehydratase family protein [Photorhabdus laumondii]|uniref:NAD-dependent epimerase/dehydratase family protein n=1 Tax=Photorhabdus laumondii TaxID=2218628 RepID=UPI0033145B4A
MKIFITGGAGFIGSNLTNKLCALGHQVTVFDILSPQIHGKNPLVTSPLFQSLDQRVSFVLGDVRDRSSLEKLILEQDAIIHLAAETGTGQSMYEIERYMDINTNGTAIILDILTNNKNNVSKFVVASSRAIYGEGKYLNDNMEEVYPSTRLDSDLRVGRFELYDNKSGNPLHIAATDEESKIHPSSIYGITKQVQEQMVMTVCPNIGISPIALRYQNVYGPGQSLSNPYTGILSIFSTRILNNNPVEIYEDGIESRDFVFIDDVVDATIKAVLSDKSQAGIYNVGTGAAVPVLTVLHEMMKHYNRNVEYSISGRYRLGDIRHNFACVKKISRELDFNAKIDFSSGVEKFCSWVLEQPLQEDTYERSAVEMSSRGLLK